MTAPIRLSVRRPSALVAFLALPVVVIAVPEADASPSAEAEHDRPFFGLRPLPDVGEPLAVHEGRTIARVDVVGNEITRRYVIDREIEARVGDVLRAQTAREDVRRLESLDIFSAIDVVPSEVGSGVALEYRVNEMPWIMPFVDLRYTEDDGVSIGPVVAALNVAGRDIFTGGRVLFGGTTTFQIIFSWPWITGNHVSLDVNAARVARDDKIRRFDEKSIEISPAIGTHLGRHGRAKAVFSWFQMRSNRDGITLSPNNVDNLIRVGAMLGYDSRDSRRTPHRGWETELLARRAGGSLGGDGNFWTFDYDLRRYQPLAPRQTLVLAGLATQQTGTPGVDIPAGVDEPGYMDFAIGGANTVRGFDNTATGRSIFGKNQFLVTAEYQYLLVPLSELAVGGWSFAVGVEAAAFVDVGLAWSEDADFNRDRTKLGFGAGLRPLIPAVRMLRFDLGFSTDGDVQFHFALDTKMAAQRLRLR